MIIIDIIVIILLLIDIALLLKQKKEYVTKIRLTILVLLCVNIILTILDISNGGVISSAIVLAVLIIDYVIVNRF